MTQRPFYALSFDFGTKSIGVAVGQSVAATAKELTPIKAKEGIPNWDDIQLLLTQWTPEIVLVGLPVNMDGSEMEMTRRARKFGKRIEGRYAQKIEFVDERLTTREAKMEAAENGHKGNYAKDPVDSIAARILLESWWREYINTQSD